jgi:aconitate hydratase 2/2-methylisocitrate dehydratase
MYEAFELTNALAEPSAVRAIIALCGPAVAGHDRTDIEMIDAILAAGYENPEALRRWQTVIRQWLANL